MNPSFRIYSTDFGNGPVYFPSKREALTRAREWSRRDDVSWMVEVFSHEVEDKSPRRVLCDALNGEGIGSPERVTAFRNGRRIKGWDDA